MMAMKRTATTDARGALGPDQNRSDHRLQRRHGAKPTINNLVAIAISRGSGTGTNWRSSATPLSGDAAGAWRSIWYPVMPESPMNDQVSKKLDGSGCPASAPGADNDDPAVPDDAGIKRSGTRRSGMSEAGRPVQRGRGRPVLETPGERGDRDRRRGQGGPMRQDGFHGMKNRRVRCELPGFGPRRIRRSTTEAVTSTSPRPL